MPRFFDARLDPAQRTDDDLANLAYFGTQAALVVPARNPARSSASDATSDLLASFGELIEVQVPRIQGYGIRTALCLGLHPDQRPRRTHHEVYRALERWAERGVVNAIGVLAVEAPEEARPQLELAAAFGLPIVVSARRSPNRVAVEAFVALAVSSGVKPQKIVFDGCDYLSLRPVLDAGGIASIDLSPNGLSTDALGMVQRYGEATLRRVVFSSAGGASIDVLAFGKVALGLERAGLPSELARRALYGNAAALWPKGSVPGEAEGAESLS